MTHCDHPFPDRFKKKCPIIIISCSHFISIHIETNLSNINSGTSVFISVSHLVYEYKLRQLQTRVRV